MKSPIAPGVTTIARMIGKDRNSRNQVHKLPPGKIKKKQLTYKEMIK